MSGFVDAYLPDKVPGWPCVSAPRTNTTIQVTAGGRERRNQNWQHPLHRFVLPEAAGRDWPTIEALKAHWLVMRGPFKSFAFRDPFDFASGALLHPNEPEASVRGRTRHTDQVLGTGDGATTTFQLAKTYAVGAESYARTIHLPLLDSLKIGAGGALVDPADYTVSRPGGAVTFDTPPGGGVALTWGGLYDAEVRFESDEAYEGIFRTWRAGGFADITLIEVRPC